MKTLIKPFYNRSSSPAQFVLTLPATSTSADLLIKVYQRQRENSANVDSACGEGETRGGFNSRRRRHQAHIEEEKLSRLRLLVGN